MIDTETSLNCLSSLNEGHMMSPAQKKQSSENELAQYKMYYEDLLLKASDLDEKLLE